MDSLPSDSNLHYVPAEFVACSLSEREIVLPYLEVLEALDQREPSGAVGHVLQSAAAELALAGDVQPAMFSLVSYGAAARA